MSNRTWPDGYQCDDCGEVFDDEPYLYTSPSFTSSDGVGQAYCELCGRKREMQEMQYELDHLRSKMTGIIELCEEFGYDRVSIGPSLKSWLHEQLIALD